jgi:thiamine-phosphate pyrophosphorylase
MNEISYRIIDANFNRAREAFRVMEEYCRFALNNPSLSAKAKSCRHILCEKFKSIDSVLLLSSRDSEGDVGKALKIEGQLTRSSVEDCFAAASKRAGEALRALGEYSQALDPEIANTMEKLRFEVYSLEKQAVLFADTKQKFESVRLCVLINATAQSNEEDLLGLIKTCIESGADCLQLRAKGLNDSQLLGLADQFTKLCRASGIVSIINDRLDIALLADADGVHFGQEDLSAVRARRLVHKPFIIGVSTHNLEELQNAIDSKCDYVGIGPVFASPTKPKLKVSGLEYIQEALPLIERAGLFHLAIGGINKDNIGRLLEAGIKSIAFSASITSSSSSADSCKVLKKLLLKTPS